MATNQKSLLLSDNDFSPDVLIDGYVKWLKSNITSYTLKNGAVSIETPFLDRNNDHLQVFLQKIDDRFKITDDCYTISDLESSGMIFNTDSKKMIRAQVLRSFGVQCSDDGELFVYANAHDFPQKKHALIQAMLSIDNMYILTRSRVATMFREEVKEFLNLNSISFIEDISILGKSGLPHAIDFIVPPSKLSPERLIKVQPKIDSNTAPSILFAWTEIQEVRSNKANLYVIADTERNAVSSKYMEALENRDVKVIRWNQRESFVSDLAS